MFSSSRLISEWRNARPKLPRLSVLLMTRQDSNMIIDAVMSNTTANFRPAQPSPAPEEEEEEEEEMEEKEDD